MHDVVVGQICEAISPHLVHVKLAGKGTLTDNQRGGDVLGLLVARGTEEHWSLVQPLGDERVDVGDDREGSALVSWQKSLEVRLARLCVALSAELTAFEKCYLQPFRLGSCPGWPTRQSR